MNIIGDVAGRFDELMELIKIMPKNEKIVLCGDLVDRGPDSKKVVEWAMNTPNVITIKGNHEDMMVDAYLDHYGDADIWNTYQRGVWQYNGGYHTIQSYGKLIEDIDPKHINFLKKLPLFYEEPGIFISHAPWHGCAELGKIFQNEYKMLWNRSFPVKRDGILQVFGHNTVTQEFKDKDGLYAICIDNSGNNELVGIHWPSKDIFKVDNK